MATIDHVHRNVISYQTTNQHLVPYSRLSQSGKVWCMLQGVVYLV